MHGPRMDRRPYSIRITNSTIVILLFLVIIISPVLSAPFHSYGRYRSPREKGCYYLLKHYQNGEQIETNEPCLNCTCVNSMLMCYLRVCPFVRPLGERCIIEKVHGECCPKITCPDVTPEPEPETHPPTTTEPAETGPGCYLNDNYYKEGAQIPAESTKPCEICYCIRNTSACVMQECALQGVGCTPIFKNGACCPSRYNCSNEAATTVPTYLKEVSSKGCHAHGHHYNDGEAVPSSNPCEHCYCMRDEVVCAVQECKPPCEGCVAIANENDKCCPERYECVAPTRTVPPVNIVTSNQSISSAFTSPATLTSFEHVTSPPTTAFPTKDELTKKDDASTPSHAVTTSIDVLMKSTSKPEYTDNKTLDVEESESQKQPKKDDGKEIITTQRISHITTKLPFTSVTEEYQNITDAHLITSPTRLTKESLITESDIRFNGTSTKLDKTLSTKSLDDSTISPKIDSTDSTKRTSIDAQSIESRIGAATTSMHDLTSLSQTGFTSSQSITDDKTTTKSITSFATIPGETMHSSTKKPTTRRPIITPGSIPGEGVCRHEGKIYQNGDQVKNKDPCMEFCMCINSVVYCDEIMCDHENNTSVNHTNCKKVHLENECCPQYQCQPLPSDSTIGLSVTPQISTNATDYTTKSTQFPSTDVTTDITKDKVSIEMTTHSVSVVKTEGTTPSVIEITDKSTVTTIGREKETPIESSTSGIKDEKVKDKHTTISDDITHTTPSQFTEDKHRPTVALIDKETKFTTPFTKFDTEKSSPDEIVSTTAHGLSTEKHEIITDKKTFTPFDRVTESSPTIDETIKIVTTITMPLSTESSVSSLTDKPSIESEEKLSNVTEKPQITKITTLAKDEVEHMTSNVTVTQSYNLTSTEATQSPQYADKTTIGKDKYETTFTTERHSTDSSVSIGSVTKLIEMTQTSETPQKQASDLSTIEDIDRPVTEVSPSKERNSTVPDHQRDSPSFTHTTSIPDDSKTTVRTFDDTTEKTHLSSVKISENVSVATSQRPDVTETVTERDTKLTTELTDDKITIKGDVSTDIRGLTSDSISQSSTVASSTEAVTEGTTAVTRDDERLKPIPVTDKVQVNETEVPSENEIHDRPTTVGDKKITTEGIITDKKDVETVTTEYTDKESQFTKTPSLTSESKRPETTHTPTEATVEKDTKFTSPHTDSFEEKVTTQRVDSSDLHGRDDHRVTESDMIKTTESSVITEKVAFEPNVTSKYEVTTQSITDVHDLSTVKEEKETNVSLDVTTVHSLTSLKDISEKESEITKSPLIISEKPEIRQSSTEATIDKDTTISVSTKDTVDTDITTLHSLAPHKNDTEEPSFVGTESPVSSTIVIETVTHQSVPKEITTKEVIDITTVQSLLSPKNVTEDEGLSGTESPVSSSITIGFDTTTIHRLTSLTNISEKETGVTKSPLITSERPEIRQSPTEATIERDTTISVSTKDTTELDITTLHSLAPHKNYTEEPSFVGTESPVSSPISIETVTHQSVPIEIVTKAPIDITTMHSVTTFKDVTDKESEITKSPLITSERPEIRKSPTDATIERDTTISIVKDSTESVNDTITTQGTLSTDVHETTEKNETKTERGTFTPLLDTVTKLLVTVSDLFTEKPTSVPEVTQTPIESQFTTKIKPHIEEDKTDTTKSSVTKMVTPIPTDFTSKDFTEDVKEVSNETRVTTERIDIEKETDEDKKITKTTDGIMTDKKDVETVTTEYTDKESQFTKTPSLTSESKIPETTHTPTEATVEKDTKFTSPHTDSFEEKVTTQRVDSSDLHGRDDHRVTESDMIKTTESSVITEKVAFEPNVTSKHEVTTQTVADDLSTIKQEKETDVPLDITTVHSLTSLKDVSDKESGITKSPLITSERPEIRQSSTEVPIEKDTTISVSTKDTIESDITTLHGLPSLKNATEEPSFVGTESPVSSPISIETVTHQSIPIEITTKVHTIIDEIEREDDHTITEKFKEITKQPNQTSTEYPHTVFTTQKGVKITSEFTTKPSEVITDTTVSADSTLKDLTDIPVSDHTVTEKIKDMKIPDETTTVRVSPTQRDDESVISTLPSIEKISEKDKDDDHKTTVKLTVVTDLPQTTIDQNVTEVLTESSHVRINGDKIDHTIQKIIDSSASITPPYDVSYSKTTQFPSTDVTTDITRRDSIEMVTHKVSTPKTEDTTLSAIDKSTYTIVPEKETTTESSILGRKDVKTKDKVTTVKDYIEHTTQFTDDKHQPTVAIIEKETKFTTPFTKFDTEKSSPEEIVSTPARGLSTEKHEIITDKGTFTSLDRVTESSPTIHETIKEVTTIMPLGTESPVPSLTDKPSIESEEKFSNFTEKPHITNITTLTKEEHMTLNATFTQSYTLTEATQSPQYTDKTTVGKSKDKYETTISTETVHKRITDPSVSIETISTKLIEMTQTSETPQKQASDLSTIEDIDRPVTEVSPSKERHSTVPDHQRDSPSFTHTTSIPDDSKTTVRTFDDTTEKTHLSSIKISENVSVATSQRPDITETITERDTKLTTELTDDKITIKGDVSTDIRGLTSDSISQSSTVASSTEAVTEGTTAVTRDDERLKPIPVTDKVQVNETEVPSENEIHDRPTTVGDKKITTEGIITDKKDVETATTEYTDKESQFTKTPSLTSESKIPETTHTPTEATVEKDTKFTSPHTDSFEGKVTTQRVDSSDLHGRDDHRVTESDMIKTTESSVITEKVAFEPNVTSKHEVTTQTVADDLSTIKQEKETDVPLDITTVHSLTSLKDVSDKESGITKSPLITSERPEIRQSSTEVPIEKDTTISVSTKDTIESDITTLHGLPSLKNVTQKPRIVDTESPVSSPISIETVTYQSVPIEIVTKAPIDITTMHSVTTFKDITEKESEITKSPLITSERPEIRKSPTDATIERDTTISIVKDSTESVNDTITTQGTLSTDVHETTEKNETKTERGTFTPLLDTVTKLLVTVSDLFTEKPTSVPEVTQTPIESQFTTKIKPHIEEDKTDTTKSSVTKMVTPIPTDFTSKDVTEDIKEVSNETRVTTERIREIQKETDITTERSLQTHTDEFVTPQVTDKHITSLNDSLVSSITTQKPKETDDNLKITITELPLTSVDTEREKEMTTQISTEKTSDSGVSSTVYDLTLRNETTTESEREKETDKEIGDSPIVTAKPESTTSKIIEKIFSTIKALTTIAIEETQTEGVSKDITKTKTTVSMQTELSDSTTVSVPSDLTETIRPQLHPLSPSTEKPIDKEMEISTSHTKPFDIKEDSEVSTPVHDLDAHEATGKATVKPIYNATESDYTVHKITTEKEIITPIVTLLPDISKSTINVTSDESTVDSGTHSTEKHRDISHVTTQSISDETHSTVSHSDITHPFKDAVFTFVTTVTPQFDNFTKEHTTTLSPKDLHKEPSDHTEKFKDTDETTSFTPLSHERRPDSTTERPYDKTTTRVTTVKEHFDTLTTLGFNETTKEILDNLSTTGHVIVTQTKSDFTTLPQNFTSTTAVPSTDETEIEDGACIYDGKVHQSAEQIPRPHPCDFCFCFRGDIICLQQTCPPPISGCFATKIEGFCCPRYECPVHVTSMNTSISSTTPSASTSLSTEPIERKGCEIKGKVYGIGELVVHASGPCLSCICDASGVMQCNPLECLPKPSMLSKDIFGSILRR